MLDPRNFPRPPSLQPITSTILIKSPGSAGPTIARTTAAYRVLETWHPPTYYVPRASVAAALTRSSARGTWCEWKGQATYWDVRAGEGEVVRGRAWSYEEPSAAFAAIGGYLSFYADGGWECFVDGERVEAQPGDFYGGWMTKDVVQENVKGAPGTRGW